MTITIKELTNHSYIDHQLSATLDSTEAFEGPEKLLEIWFYPNKKCLSEKNTKTLRNIEVNKWVQILKLVQCEVLSIKSTSDMDAFLLSESSLFVYDHKITLKTCGTTTTLFCLEELFKIIEVELGWIMTNEQGKYEPFKVFYSRRSFMFPLKQRSIHKNWNDEVDYLNKFFANGRSYLVGRNDKENHWNLYVTDTNKKLRHGSSPDSEKDDDEDDDETLEILMTGLNSNCSQQFVCNREIKPIANGVKDTTTNINKTDGDADDEGHLLGYNMTKKTKLDKIYENNSGVSFHHDAFAFSPCGYSSNMILDEQYYYTLHITPEKGWSYASFESNVPVKSISLNKQDNIDVMRRVINVFNPKEFCMTFFCKGSSSTSFIKLMNVVEQIPNYSKRDKIVYDLEDYQLLYIRFELKDHDVDKKIE
ncbi:adenosylmethionine decarboxylase SPE2 NDAI_0K00700 [Naumovozyma dairenensis CBS 421]|uniref:adenosylmethionine decarboxylase n=1 Tax=Naumovozyma dairenensis (strain ATCC 10597 / BCRC 20456 / CBS 421 / NBRC 0211 / NRRL Y-12639) TaxID=1071378 RepID=G0WHK0_NAUDC|nr:hypothetical protein NDAI_0K00700 [Naumovozyma dairenensis CBS 421]CCD27261.1 hypothetical protein NDAI_0K00700 [Naumovozyma dairenensis CBS 421]